MNKLKELWSKLPEAHRKHLVSALNTFVSTLLLQLSVQFSQQGWVELDKKALMSLGFVAIRAAWKATVAQEAANAKKPE